MTELIAFYSRAGENYVSGEIRNLPVGNTELAASYLKEATGADLFKIEPCCPYSHDYSECINQARSDQMRNARPELVHCPKDMRQYEVLYLGFPNYWGTMPMCVFTFLEQCHFQGSKIILFCTHEGDGFGRSVEDVKHIYPDVFIECGPAIRGICVPQVKDIINQWMEGESVK